MEQTIDSEAAWAAFTARDRGADGRFVVGVRTTGIYCRPSCPARRPRRENVSFHADGAAARTAGLRPCLRCLPDEAGRDQVAVSRAAAMLDRGEPATLGELAAEVGYAPHHFQRLFTRATGVSPAAYARARRTARAAEALTRESNVTDAIYEAGYAAPSRFYDEASPRLGMAPATWRAGGAGETIRWTQAETVLGALLIAATARGICRVAFDEDEAALRARFPHATIVPGDDDLAGLAAQVVAQVEEPGRDLALPLDVRGTAFQEAVWQALRSIPAGETRSYAELAAMAGRPGAVRAAGTACGSNAVAVLIPCHRVLRADGGLGGYAYGPERKRDLLTWEAERKRRG
ncbi:bifunctional DNA-binding transcriptional regulator/O6-methylguanine-DNA methyltransferase Ada [Sphingomonas sp. KR1UV-12]|uniref:Bifunctional DNA-binding transcriptional regulator/O6-methylguanine-DNA methyltransferase Ada n=1 Tax=Sphingomonas aurea TaxID=3063994 RepID=A0ABT9EL16_9SPHN|nr:bifunctional DNA-binding transcriptional regulator/O6-methylguanine-DNA methyltransferase Ada [Sphingomonas sp. KR1UV-12]MDP1027532.1 bifunctional DNA-binding transcriptional regulator/O6-methylguanine-DNA methyltransferase Ada [Sphingomonas sp. KR1UV-12]